MRLNKNTLSIMILYIVVYISSSSLVYSSENVVAIIQPVEPVVYRNEIGRAQLLFLVFNIGDSPIKPNIEDSTLIINGTVLPKADSSFMFGNGPRDARWNSLPSKEVIHFGYGASSLIKDQPIGVINIQWIIQGVKAETKFILLEKVK